MTTMTTDKTLMTTTGLTITRTGDGGYVVDGVGGRIRCFARLVRMPREEVDTPGNDYRVELKDRFRDTWDCYLLATDVTQTQALAIAEAAVEAMVYERRAGGNIAV